MTVLLTTVTADEKVFWYIALGMALVVILVVIVVLALLVSLVKDIDDGVFALWEVTKRLAINTTGMYQLAGTASVLRAMREEFMRQEKMLTERNGMVAQR